MRTGTRKHPTKATQLIEQLEDRQYLSGLTIVPSFAPNIISDPNAAQIKAAINAGINQIESDFSAPITVHIMFQEGDSSFDSSGDLGGSSTSFDTVSYSAYRAALVAHLGDANQAAAIASLPTGAKNPDNVSTQICISTANARALGLANNTGPKGLDSTITFDIPCCNLTRTSINPNNFDLQSVAMHEIDEALGIGSVLTGVMNGAPVPSGEVEPLDLYRYSSSGSRSFTTSASAAVYFSVDGGKTDLARFNQLYGDGDYNDWYSVGNVIPEVQDAAQTAGVIPYYNVEPVVLDVLGYTPTRALGTGIITGSVFNDADGNGGQDPGEPKLSGATIEAVQNGNVIASTQSNALGYAIGSLPDGTYTIKELPPAGFVQEVPVPSYSVTITGHNDIVNGNNFDNSRTLYIHLSNSFNNVTLRVDPANTNNLEILSGTSAINVPFSSFSSVTVIGGASSNNSLTVDYSSAFFGAPVTYDGGTGAGAVNSVSIIDYKDTSARQWDVGPASIAALDTGESVNPTVNWNVGGNVSLKCRSSGNETILSQSTPNISHPIATTTLDLAASDTVDVQGTSNNLIINGSGAADSVTIGTLAPSTGGTLADITAAVSVDNIAILTVDDRGDATGRTGIISPNFVLGFGLPSSVGISYANLGSLAVYGGRGANAETVDGPRATTTLFPGASAASTVSVQATTNPLTINGDAIVNIIDIGSLAPALGGTLNAIAGAIAIENTAAGSTLSLDDSGDATGRTGTISGSIITGFGLAPGNLVEYNAARLQSLTVRGGQGTNTDTVTGTSVPTFLYPNTNLNAATVNVQATTAPLTINGGTFPEAINIGSLAPSLGGTLTGITGTVTVTNTSKMSQLSLDDSGDAANQTGKISSSSVTGFGLGAAVDYTGSQLASLTVRGGAGTNTDIITGTSTPTFLYPNTGLNEATVNVRATTAALTINGSTFQEAVNVGSLAPSLGGTLTGIAGPITVTNTSRNSTLSLDDSGDATARTGTISSASVTGFGLGAAVNYTGSQLGALTVRGGAGANTETVTGTSVATTLYPGTVNASTVGVQSTTAALTINGNGKTDDITIGSLAPSLGGTLTSIAGTVNVTNTSNTSTLDVDDSGDTKAEDGTLTAASLTGLGMANGAAVDYIGSQLGSLTVRGGEKGGVLAMTGTSTTTVVIGLTVVQ